MLPAQKLKGYGVLKIIKKYSFQADVLILNKIIDELINSTMGTCSAGFRWKKKLPIPYISYSQNWKSQKMLNFRKIEICIKPVKRPFVLYH